MNPDYSLADWVSNQGTLKAAAARLIKLVPGLQELGLDNRLT